MKNKFQTLIIGAGLAAIILLTLAASPFERVIGVRVDNTGALMSPANFFEANASAISDAIGGAGSPVWGAITGDIADQTDLQDSFIDATNASNLTVTLGTVFDPFGAAQGSTNSARLTIQLAGSFDAINAALNATQGLTSDMLLKFASATNMINVLSRWSNNVAANLSTTLSYATNFAMTNGSSFIVFNNGNTTNSGNIQSATLNTTGALVAGGSITANGDLNANGANGVVTKTILLGTVHNVVNMKTVSITQTTDLPFFWLQATQNKTNIGILFSPPSQVNGIWSNWPAVRVFSSTNAPGLGVYAGTNDNLINFAAGGYLLASNSLAMCPTVPRNYGDIWIWNSNGTTWKITANLNSLTWATTNIW